MNDLTDNFGTLYYPKSALVFYETTGTETDIYVEHFDMDSNGNPINAHPLTVKEANLLARSLQTDEERNKAFLKPQGVLPTNILHIDPSEKGAVIWYTKAQQRQLYFVESLGIQSGTAHVPAMVWKADKNHLAVYALATDRRPNDKTKLHYAPFFNIYKDGKVCMGTVSIDIKNSVSVEEFIQAWEDYFFNSYFSHLMGYNTTRGYCDSLCLWKYLIKTGEDFPKERLKKNDKTLKNILR